MMPETANLIAALQALKQQIPKFCLTLFDGTLSFDKRTEFGELLIQIGQLVRQHDPEVNLQVIEDQIVQTSEK